MKMDRSTHIMCSFEEESMQREAAKQQRPPLQMYALIGNTLQVLATLAAPWICAYLVLRDWVQRDIGINVSANALFLLFLYIPVCYVLFSAVGVISHYLSRKRGWFQQLFTVLLCLTITGMIVLWITRVMFG